ncbi:MAG: RNA methyltransferase [Lachnospiraceae bacterium]|nr:RNA methyltransferase [Lachnospiraceae bacterium]
MAQKTERFDEVARFLAATAREMQGSEPNEEYKERLEAYAERMPKVAERNAEMTADDDPADGTAAEGVSLTCYLSVINILQGVMILDTEHAVCLIAADSERAVRDLIRNVPNDITFDFYFEDRYQSVAGEYICREDIPERPCRMHGMRRANPAGTTARQKSERVINSKKDDIVAEFKKLTTLKARIDNDRVVMEGFLMVNRALKDHLPVEKVVYSDALGEEQRRAIADACIEAGIAYYRVSAGILAAMTSTNPTPDVLCTVRAVARSQDQLIFSRKRNFFLILDGIANPDNLGMVLRTADASGVDAVILLSPSTHHFNKNAIRGARGAVGRVPIYFCSDDMAMMETLRAHNFRIWGTSARFSASNFYDMRFDEANIAVIVGNESNGVRKEILDLCTDYVKIPMVEGQSSLNIAVAAALVLYEYDREFYKN